MCLLVLTSTTMCYLVLTSANQVKMFPDHVKVIGDGAFFSQLMQMKDGYTDGHQGQWFTTPEVTEATMKEVLSSSNIFQATKIFS